MTALPRRRLAVLVAALAGSLATAGALLRPRRLEVTGDSMLPTLRPGDRVLLVGSVRHRRSRVGELVAARDPRQPSRVLIKRVAGVRPDGLLLHGDNPDGSTDSREFGTVPPSLVVGRVVYRYHPPERAGRIDAPGSTDSIADNAHSSG